MPRKYGDIDPNRMLEKHRKLDGLHDTIVQLADMAQADYSYYDGENGIGKVQAAWKYQLLLDLRIAQAHSEMDALPADEYGMYSYTYYELPEMIGTVTKACLEAIGFTVETYEMESYDDILCEMGLGDSGRVMDFMEHIAEGDVFGEDTVMLLKFMDFVEEMGCFSELSYVQVNLFKNPYFGRLVERAKKLELTRAKCYYLMNRHLEQAFDIPGMLFRGSGDTGVQNGVYYAYMTLYDYEDTEYGEANMTWCNRTTEMVWHVAKAMVYAKELELLIDQKIAENRLRREAS